MIAVVVFFKRAANVGGATILGQAMALFFRFPCEKGKACGENSFPDYVIAHGGANHTPYPHHLDCLCNSKGNKQMPLLFDALKA